jgi:hypothetical protein
MPKTSTDVAQQLKRLPGMSAPELRAMWCETFGRPHPGYVHKDFLVRALGYHIQEKAYGGLRPATRRRLLKLAREIESGAKIALFEAPKIKPGTRLVRGWRGDTHVVTVLEEGFEYQERRYGSLSEIARLVTGTRWSGPAFFGLKAGSGRSEESKRG